MREPTQNRVWLVRHGPTHAKAMVGWTDLPADLSDLAALARLNAHLPHVPVISSDLSRAITTADALSPRLRLPHDPDWRELHFGDWEMRSYTEVEAETPDQIRGFWERPGKISAPSGESWDAVTTRIDRALARLAPLPEVIVVAHFGAIIAAIQRAGGLSALEAFSHKIDNLSVTCLEFGPAPKVISINHIP